MIWPFLWVLGWIMVCGRNKYSKIYTIVVAVLRSIKNIFLRIFKEYMGLWQNIMLKNVNYRFSGQLKYK
jgi:hypothetical protein